ncbi:MAG TPA: tetratricopeptide repeat protein [Flavobacterium sp.]|nr:tetratricopeptide repeat protein [Flavobacterium sp.]
MRKIIICLLLAIATPVFAQDSVEDLIKEGVALHDEGNFEQAIKAYQKVLAIEKDNLEAKYEIALSYTGMKEHTKAIEYAEELIKSKTDYVAKGYHLKGMNLDYSGKKKEAIAAFKKGIKASPEYTTLYYSVAITSMAIEEYKDAEKALKDGLEINPNHAASNYMLAVLHQDERSKSLLALYYFLILEPEGQRSNAAYNLILSQHKIGLGKRFTINYY